MPRKKLIRTKQFYYHITTRSNHKEWFSIPLLEVWDICVNSFQIAQKNNPATVSQFVLMANHYHLLIKTPNEDIDKFMYWFNKTFSEQLRKKSGLKNRMFGGNYKWSIITTDKYFYNVYRYIYQNPLRAGVVERCEEYPFSTLFFSHFNLDIPFPFEYILQLKDQNHYLNTEFSKIQNISISKGLKKSYFKLVTPRKY